MNETRRAGRQKGAGRGQGRQSGTRPAQPFNTLTHGFCGSCPVLCRGEIAHKRENTSGEPCCGGSLEGKTPGLTRNITRSDTQEIGHQQVGKRAESGPSRSLYAGRGVEINKMERERTTGEDSNRPGDCRAKEGVVEVNNALTIVLKQEDLRLAWTHFTA